MAQTIIKATLVGIIFENKRNHYIVGRFSETETYHPFTAVGYITDPNEEEEYELTGDYVVHPKYGRQFKFVQAVKLLPTNEEAIVRFLSSDAFPTIGKKTAQQIYDTLGDDALNAIQNDPHSLQQVPKMNAAKRKIIIEGIQSFEGFSNTYAQLLQFGLSPEKISLLEKNYDQVMDVLKENCFRPYYEINGFGYKSALKLADGMHINKNDPIRFDAYINEILCRMIMQNQDTYIEESDLYAELSKIDPIQIQEALNHLVNLESITVHDYKIYPFGLYEEEELIAQKLKEHSFQIEKVDAKILDQKIKEVEFEDAISYDKIQKQAICSFFNRSLMLLNGGPGTGKTTIVKAILKMCKTIFPNAKIQLCAPTGRASKRLAQLSNYDSKTIHSLLKWNMEDNSFGYDHSEPLDIDFLIVDEFSMVDTHIFAHLLDALPNRCRLLLIGDENQLESVGPGKVFKDLIDSHQFPIIHLEKIYRQLHGSGIVTLANEIRLNEPCTYKDGVTFIEKKTSDILPCVLEIAQNYAQDDMQILAPMYQRAAGIDQINAAMQQLVNPHDPNSEEYRIGDTTFRVDDKVMLLKNMPEEDVYNGDIGTIAYIERNKKDYCISVDFGFTMVDFTADILYYLKHAWCISIHKAQGSEYPIVLCIVDRNTSYMLNKRLLYTAISRAKKQLFIIGQQAVFEKSLQIQPRHLRKTTLEEKIIQKFKRTS